MLPHIIFGDAIGYHAGPEMWHCERSEDAPAHIRTSGVTQPPMAAEAVVRVGEKLDSHAQHEWYTEMYPKVLKYHQWFYRERNPRGAVYRLLFYPGKRGWTTHRRTHHRHAEITINRY